jgi:hypothetical protein
LRSTSRLLRENGLAHQAELLDANSVELDNYDAVSRKNLKFQARQAQRRRRSA